MDRMRPLLSGHGEAPLPAPFVIRDVLTGPGWWGSTTSQGYEMRSLSAPIHFCGVYYSGEATATRNNSKPQCFHTERFLSHSGHPSRAGPLLPLLGLMAPTPARTSWDGSPTLWGWLAWMRSVGLRRAFPGQAWGDEHHFHIPSLRTQS